MQNNKRKLKTVATIVTALILAVTLLVIFGFRWVFQTWFDLSMEEIVYHLRMPLDGTNTDMIWDYIRVGVVPAVVVFSVFCIGLCKSRKSDKYRKILIVIFACSIVTLMSSTVYAARRLHVVRYFKSESENSNFIDTYYVDPNSVKLDFPEQKRNLIYIFMESMETAYQDVEHGGVFGKNLIPELTELATENENFSGRTNEQSGAYALPWTTWTVAGMFAETSGLPLHVSIDVNSMDTQNHFFPGITNL